MPFLRLLGELRPTEELYTEKWQHDSQQLHWKWLRCVSMETNLRNQAIWKSTQWKSCTWCTQWQSQIWWHQKHHFDVTVPRSMGKLKLLHGKSAWSPLYCRNIQMGSSFIKFVKHALADGARPDNSRKCPRIGSWTVVRQVALNIADKIFKPTHIRTLKKKSKCMCTCGYAMVGSGSYRL